MTHNEDAKPGDPDYTFKCLLIGDSGTGKSSLLLRFTDDTFLDDEMSATIGVDFKIKPIHLPSGPRVKLTIWDTAGQERFRTLTSSYYRGAQGVILVYDVTSRASFVHLKEVWLPELETYSASKAVVKMVVGNKVDKGDAVRAVSREEGEALAREQETLFIECSAKTKVGVQQAFEELVEKIVETPELYQKRSPGGQERVTLDQQNADEGAGACAC